MLCACWLRVGEPQEEGYDVDSSKFPLNNLPKVIEPVGLDDLRKVVVDVGGASPNNVESTQHKPEFCPTRNREVVNPSSLAEQRVNSTVWKTVGVARNSKQSIAAGVCNSM